MWTQVKYEMLPTSFADFNTVQYLAAFENKREKGNIRNEEYWMISRCKELNKH